MSIRFLYIGLVLSLIVTTETSAQQLPVLRTNIDPIHIRDGADFYPNE